MRKYHGLEEETRFRNTREKKEPIVQRIEVVIPLIDEPIVQILSCLGVLRPYYTRGRIKYSAKGLRPLLASVDCDHLSTISCGQSPPGCC